MPLPHEGPKNKPENTEERPPKNAEPSTGANVGAKTQRVCPFCHQVFAFDDLGRHARYDPVCSPRFSAQRREYETVHKRIDYTEIPEGIDPDEMTDAGLGRLVRRNKQQLEFFKVQQKLKDVGVQRTGDRGVEMMLLQQIFDQQRDEVSRLRRSLSSMDDDIKTKKEDHAYELEKMEIQHMHEASMKKWDIIIAEILDTKKTLKPIVKIVGEAKVKEYLRQQSSGAPKLTPINEGEMEEIAKRSEQLGFKLKKPSTEQQNDETPPPPPVDAERAKKTIDELPDDPPVTDDDDDQDDDKGDD